MLDKVYIATPYAPHDKRLGKAYNEFMSLLPDGAWACFIDIDFMFLTSDAGKHLYEYSKLATKNMVLTPFASRMHEDSKMQLLNGSVSQDTDILNHINLAEKQKSSLYNLTYIPNDLSGCVIMLNKDTWENCKFNEDRYCLGVDTDFSKQCREKQVPLMRMDGIYGWHTYRLLKGVTNKDHIS